MVVSLIGTTDNELVQRVLMVAAFAGVPLKLVPIREGVDNCTEAYRLNCHPLQLVPVMKTGEGYLFEANAMVRYLARIEVPLSQLVSESVRYPHPQYPIPYTLYGHSLLEVAQIDNWLDFVAYRIDPLTLPLLQQQQQQRAQLSSRSLSSTNTSTALRSGRAGNASQTIQVTIRVDATTKQELWRHMTYLENTLQHLREQRKQWLKEMSAPPIQAISNNNTAPDNNTNTNNNISTTARTSSYADAELLREEELSILIARGRQSQLGALYNVASAVRDRHEEQDKAAKEEQLEDIRRQTELLDENQEGNGAEKIGRRTSTSALSPRLSSVSMGRDTPASGVGTSLVGLQQQQQQHAYTARASYTPRSSRLGVAPTLQRYDFVFLVGETLTAADIVVADGLHHFFGLLQNTNTNESAAWRAETTSTFPQCYKYYKSVMMLPIATDMRRALHVSIVGV